MLKNLSKKLIFTLGLLSGFAPLLAQGDGFEKLSKRTLPPLHALSGISDTLELSPFWDWKVIETEHFRLTFPADLAETAMKSANYLEEANTFLSQSLYWQPSGKTPILVIDNTDFANGLTSPIEDFGIVFMVAPPDNFSSTYAYDNWLRLLAIHEYTHFLNMDATRSLYAPLRYLLGDLPLPNSLWPSWMLEGLAVYDETRYTHSGRGRSTYYDMILRAAAERGTLDTDDFVTLDRVNGPNPYFPEGETAYLFGYHLMNQVASTTPAGPTADHDGMLKSGQDALGVMSLRSSQRVPYLINGNLENITGKDWYHHWDDWITSVRKRAGEELATIHKQPVTAFDGFDLTKTGPIRYNVLTAHHGVDAYGSAVSPDGKYIAFTQETLEERMGLFIREIKTGETRRLDDKLSGTTFSFTPDSKTIIYSSIRRTNEFYLFNDLVAYDLVKDRRYWLTEAARAEDPTLHEENGHLQVAYTLIKNQGTRLALSELSQGTDGEWKLDSSSLKEYVPGTYDHIANPAFSPDGKTIAFSLHRNGLFQEDIALLDVASLTAKRIVENTHFNRYPAYKANGELYYVSDRTGVDNLYRYREGAPSEQWTNLTTGLRYPAFSRDGSVAYGTVLTAEGWFIGELELPKTPIQSDLVTLSPIPVPSPDENSNNHSVDKVYSVDDYSLWPSILPRLWYPLFYLESTGAYFGYQTYGYDAADRHRYAAGLFYDTETASADYYADYTNRSLGVNLSLTAQNEIQSTLYFENELAAYSRLEQYSFVANYPFLWTFSYLQPELALNVQRLKIYEPGNAVGGGGLVYESIFVPSMDIALSYSDVESSPLAIFPEEGQSLTVGVRNYFNLGTPSMKGILLASKYFRIFDHTVIIPSFNASVSNAFNANYAPADTVLQGRVQRITTSFPADNFDQLAIRGYPGYVFFAKSAGIAAVDFRVPLSNIYRGWGTNPATLQTVYGIGFFEATYLPGKEVGYGLLTSAGLGIAATATAFFQAPLTASIQFHQGFRTEVGGSSELFFTLSVPNLGI
jgi:hypothetical protein